ncbi:MAG: DNA recombination protein RmuC [Phycisphaerae bacterium]|nr:DNA recombination protein RmuC [Phycisphaerae bacterium]
MEIAILAAVAVIVGVIAGWYLALRRAKASEDRVEVELRRQISDRDAEIGPLRTRQGELIAEKTAAITAKELAEKQLSDAQRIAREQASQLDGLRTQLSGESAQLSKAKAELDATKNLLTERQAVYDRQLKESRDAQDKAIADLREAFKALSADALKQNAPEFLRLAREAFGRLQESAQGDLQRRQEAIAGLLKPLEEHLRTYQQRLQQSETNQSQMMGEVKKQLEMLGQQSQSLASETERFRMVLKSNQARGRWGEETLRRVVEAAGMSAHCDFIEQAKEEDKKPDMIVRLPGDRVIIVDSKVPDLDFINALETADLEKRTRLLEAHAARLKETMKDLEKRDYPAQFKNALDYVVLFLPAESLFSAALEGDRDLIIWAANNRIMIATPASLIGLLRSVSVSWQQFAQTENARSISEAAQELYARVAKFTEHFERIRSGLGKANEAFNDAVGSYERMVRPSGERLLKLGLATGGKDLMDVQPIDSSLRLPPSAEGTGQGTGQPTP